MISFLNDYAKKNLEKLIDGAFKELRYICCFTCIAKEFEAKKVGLEAQRTTVGQRVKVAKRSGEDIQANALFWEDEADKIIQEDTKTKQKCFFGLCPDCIWRYRRGKELEIKKEQINYFMETGKELAISLPAPLPDAERYSSRHYISFKSRELKYNELLEALKDENNFIIGLQGMGGTGKTTLAREVGKMLKQSKQFTCVIVTTVSFSPNIKKIQDDIAGPLGLTFEGCTESDRPLKLWKRLTDGEKILLVLDDVWRHIDFEEIGIPYGDKHEGCRVLVTTRNVDVCNTLGCSKTIRLELLSKDDAWDMFKRHADLTETSTTSLLDKGCQIADECKGLPIAIAVIARSLKGKQRPEEWDFALKSLQKYASMQKIDDVDANLVKIYECLKFSYDNMSDAKAKRLFLLCSVFREDEEIPTESLIRLGIGAGLFGEDYGSYEYARSQVVRSKDKLIDSFLLLEVDHSIVKMHDLVRDAAQWMANKEIQTVKLYNKNKKTMVERDKNIKYLLCEGNDVLSCKLDSSKLQILIVTMNSDGDLYNEKIKIPNSFFENISGLRVFHFCNDISLPSLSLPQSIQLLKNIRSLLFMGVDLGDISILGNLQSLETLDLNFCKINEFPEGLAKLQNLRLLKFKMCEITSNNPFKVFERCSSLEELYFINSFSDCCRDISLPMLQRFTLDDGVMYDGSLSICVSLLNQNYKHLLSEKQLKNCIQAVEVLRLTGIWWEWVNIVPEMVPTDHGMNDLVELNLSLISQLKCLIDTKHGSSQVTTVFSKLVVLELAEMESLEELCNGPISFDSLKSLEKLTITSCHQLQRLFTCNLNLFNLKSLSLLDCPMLIFSLFQLTTSRSLVSLEKLVIIGCSQLEYILIDERKVKESRGEVDDDDDDDDDDNDRKRSQDSIFGHDLMNNFQKCDVSTYSPISRDASKPEQQSDPMKGSTLSWTNICCFGKKYWHKSMTTARTKIPLVSEDQQQLQDLPSKTTSFLVGPKNSFSLNYLTLINIVRCEKLEIVFSSSILRCLPQLIFLRIEECEELKHIIIDDLENEKSINVQSINTYFPKLEILVVVNCNKLKCVFQTSLCKELPKLEILVALNCNKLKCVFQTSLYKELPKLKVLMVQGAYELQEIFKTEGDDQKLEIPNLELVAFIDLPNLCYAQGMHFQAVKYCLVRNCHKLSLTTESEPIGMDDIFNMINGFVYFGIDYESSVNLIILLQSILNSYKSHDTYNENSSSEAASESGSILTSSQPQVLMNEQSMDQQLLTNQQHSLGETDTTIKPQLDGSVTPEKTLAANSSTISETKKEPPIQLSAVKQKGVEISAEEEIASTNVKTLTSSTHSKTDRSPSPHLELVSSSSDPLITSELKPSSQSMQKDGDCQIATTSLSMGTKETNDEVSLNADASKKVSSNIEEQFPKDDKKIFSKSKPSPSISSLIPSPFASIPSKGDPSQKEEELSSSLLVTRELEQLVSKNYEKLSWLTDFLVKHPSILLKDTSLSIRYKGYAYNCLAELLKFLQTHSVLDVLGPNHSEFVELLQDVRKCGFDKDWLDGIERRVLFPDIQVSKDALQSLDSKQQAVSKEVEVLRLKIDILNQSAEDLKHQLIDLKHQLTSSEAVLESIVQQKTVLSGPIGY